MKARILVLPLLFATLLPSAARADSGGATINTLPDSYQLEGHVEVSHACGGIFDPERSCSWFGEAAQYPANVVCPGVFDASHSVWIGPLEQESMTSYGSFSFIPEASEIVLCLYVDAESTSLVGQSHPFSTRTGGEVLPHSQGRYPSRTSAFVTVHGCKIKPHILINGSEEAVGGKSAWTLIRGHEHIGGSILAKDEFSPFKESPGRYRFDARFLGDSHLQPSSKTASFTFRIKHC